jgi:hypothetical protein
MTVQQEFCYKDASSIDEDKKEGWTYLLGRLVEHLALRRKRSRAFDEIV